MKETFETPKGKETIEIDDKLRDSYIEQSLTNIEDCRNLIVYIEDNPVPGDATYTNILTEAQNAYRDAADAEFRIFDHPCDSNRRIIIAKSNLNRQKDRLDHLLKAEARVREEDRHLLDGFKAQGDRQLKEFDEMKKPIIETRQGVGVIVQHLLGANKPPHIEEAEAVAIMKRKGGDMTDRTLRNWLKAGKAGRVKTPIAWDDLTTVASWSAWVDAYLAAENTRLKRKSFISERAGKVEDETARRRSPAA